MSRWENELAIIERKKNIISFEPAVRRLLPWSVFEGDLQFVAAKVLSVETVYRADRLAVVGHRHKPETFSLIIILSVSHNTDFLNCTKRREHLPESKLIRLSPYIVHKQHKAKIW